jgi:hypothetical protein
MAGRADADPALGVDPIAGVQSRTAHFCRISHA